LEVLDPEIDGPIEGLIQPGGVDVTSFFVGQDGAGDLKARINVATSVVGVEGPVVAVGVGQRCETLGGDIDRVGCGHDVALNDSGGDTLERGALDEVAATAATQDWVTTAWRNTIVVKVVEYGGIDAFGSREFVAARRVDLDLTDIERD